MLAYARVHYAVTDLADRNATKTLKTQNICQHYEYNKIGIQNTTFSCGVPN